MATYDILCLRIELLESLHISRGDTFTSFGNAILDDILEVDINGFKMHVHLILPVGYSVPSNTGQAAETLIIPAVDIAKLQVVKPNHTEQGSTLLWYQLKVRYID